MIMCCSCAVCRGSILTFHTDLGSVNTINTNKSFNWISPKTTALNQQHWCVFAVRLYSFKLTLSKPDNSENQCQNFQQIFHKKNQTTSVKRAFIDIQWSFNSDLSIIISIQPNINQNHGLWLRVCSCCFRNMTNVCSKSQWPSETRPLLRFSRTSSQIVIDHFLGNSCKSWRVVNKTEDI